MTLILFLMLALFCVQLHSKMELKFALGFSKLYFESCFHSTPGVKTQCFGWEGLGIRESCPLIISVYPGFPQNSYQSAVSASAWTLTCAKQIDVSFSMVLTARPSRQCLASGFLVL